MRPYLYMTKMKLLLSLNYRFDFFITLFVQFTLLFTSAFFWKAAYKNATIVGMVSEDQMLIYSVMSIILANIFITTVESNIKSKVRMGNVAVDYIKPVNVFLMYLSEDIGNMVTSVIQRIIPVLIGACLFIVVPVPASPVHFVLFLISSGLSYIILWQISAIIGLLYFKFIDMGPVGIIKDYLIKIFSGAFVPIWFFPHSFQETLKYLPFIYTYQLPLSLFIGRTSAADGVKGMLVQVIWIIIFGLSFLKMKRYVEQNVFVQGG